LLIQPLLLPALYTIVHSMATGMVSAPCLDATGDAPVADIKTVGATSEPQLSCDNAPALGVIGKVGASPEQESILDEVRRSVLVDVDTKLADKTKDLWSRGNKMLKQIDQENQEYTAKFLEELAQCREKQDSLKVEQDNLRTLLAGMVQQFSMLGALYAQSPAVPLAPDAKPPNTPGLAFVNAPTESSAASDAGSSSATTGLENSPPQLSTPAGYSAGAFPPLPTMPDFPFQPASGAPSPSTATPLSLVEALCSDAVPSNVPVCLMGSLSQAPSADVPAATVFSFTLRKAEGTDLGINVSHHEHDKVLWVEGIRPEGAVEAWNRQCMSNAAGEKAVIPGDRIVMVNAVFGHPVKMLEECRDKLLLKFTIERGGVVTRTSPTTPTAAAVAAAATPKATTLRAEATEFVPAGLATPTEQLMPEPPGLATEA